MQDCYKKFFCMGTSGTLYSITLIRSEHCQIEFTTEKGLFPNFAPLIFSFWTVLPLYEEIRKKLVYQNCSPKCQLKVEPSTVIIHAQTDEIYHLKGQKTASRVVFLLGKRALWLWMKSYINK